MTVASPITLTPKEKGQNLSRGTPRHFGEEDFFLTLFQAMIEAAKATSSLDDETHFLVSHEIKSSPRERVTKEQLLTDLERPNAPDRLVKKAANEQQRIDLYLAARLAVDPHKAKDSLYLDALKQRLELDDATIERAQNCLFETIKQTPPLH